MVKKRKFHIIRQWNRIFVRKKYKDRLFRKVFQNKNDLLALYNAVSHTDYKDPAALEITTIDNAIYMSMKNDLSFLIGSVMNLYEHQSTFNPNMPLRGLSYFARLYEAYTAQHKHNVYGRKLIPLPMPQYIVFYNGREDQPDESWLKLSDAFLPPFKDGDTPVLECRVRMLNINLGHNLPLMQDCRRLWEYSTFMNEVRHNLDRGFSLEHAVNAAMDNCIRQDILKDILLQCRSEVLLMFLTEYDEKLHLDKTFEEGRETGLEQGRKLGLEQGQKLGLEQGQKLGLEQGQKLGLEQGQDQILFLMSQLLKENRLEDLDKALSDKHYLIALLHEYHLD